MNEIEQRIEVRYSCHACGIVNAACLVPARGDEDVLVWTDMMVRELSAHHDRISPLCRPHSLQNIMIPIEGADRIGGAPVN